MDLPKNEASFTFDVVGNITNKKYDGEFTVICVPSLIQRRAIELERARLTGDTMNPSPTLSGMAIALSNLRIRIIVSPGWWKDSNEGNNLIDDNIVAELFEKVLQQEDEWREKVKKIAVPESEELGNPSVERK